uniref:Uncharacterized protein n=1 Tax=Oryza punctata TaxID=4537 RepID=A0A0E0JGF4_ORYPU
MASLLLLLRAIVVGVDVEERQLISGEREASEAERFYSKHPAVHRRCVFFSDDDVEEERSILSEVRFTVHTRDADGGGGGLVEEGRSTAAVKLCGGIGEGSEGVFQGPAREETMLQSYNIWMVKKAHGLKLTIMHLIRQLLSTHAGAAAVL